MNENFTFGKSCAEPGLIGKIHKLFIGAARTFADKGNRGWKKPQDLLPELSICACNINGHGGI